MPILKELPAWKALEDHRGTISGTHLRELFKHDPERGQRMSIEAAGAYLDYSKNRITDETIKLLLHLAEESGLRARIDAMFRGEKINITENRAVLHVALRAPRELPLSWTAATLCPKSMLCSTRWRPSRTACAMATGRATLANASATSSTSASAAPTSDRSMAYEALKHYSERAMTFRFVSNVDGTDFAEAVRDLDPAETLFIVSSKTFTTLETMTNAHSARDWLLDAVWRR